jgi:hypothetical protein
MNDNTFNVRSLTDLINKVEAANGHCKLTYFCYSEPSEYEKEIIKSYGAEYKVIENKLIPSDTGVNTAFIIPTHELPIKITIAGEQNENN